VDQGAWWSRDEDNSKFSLTLAPAVGFTAVSGNESKFRQLAWQNDQWRGGLEAFELTEQVSPGAKYTVSGHALTDDYLVTLLVERPEQGFAVSASSSFAIRCGHRRLLSGVHAVRLQVSNRNLHLDVGRAWADFGLTLPDWPRLVFGYEYQYRNGDKATLQWGTVSDGTLPGTKNIYPASKAIDEHTQVLKFDLDYEHAGWRLEDNFRGEWTDSSTRQENLFFLSLGASEFANPGKRAARLESVSGRKHATRRAAASSLALQFGRLSLQPYCGRRRLCSLPGCRFGGPLVLQYTAQRIALERQSQVANANVMLGPWQGGTLTFGVQGEWTRQNGNLDGTGDPLGMVPVGPAGFTNNAITEIDKLAVDESVALRYTPGCRSPRSTRRRACNRRVSPNRKTFWAIPCHLPRRSYGIPMRRVHAFDVRAGFDTSPAQLA